MTLPSVSLYGFNSKIRDIIEDFDCNNALKIASVLLFENIQIFHRVDHAKITIKSIAICSSVELSERVLY